MDRLGWDIGIYYSSEFDKYPRSQTQINFPDIIHLWDVRTVKPSDLERIDILIWGSPCQDLSNAKINWKGLAGEKSGLFFEYVRILKECKPTYFLLENVASMKKTDRDTITDIMWVDPILINSDLVSAQNRKRLYWTNIPGIKQPEDRKIYIKDILEDIPIEDKLWKKIPDKYITPEGIVRINEATKKWYVDCYPGEVVDMSQETSSTRRGRRKIDKLPTITTWNWLFVIWVARDRIAERLRIPEDQDKLPTLRANMGTGGNNIPFLIDPWSLIWRPLTPIECERAQTLPDNFTKDLSNSRRYKAIGNGWTVEVISHIFKYCIF